MSNYLDTRDLDSRLDDLKALRDGKLFWSCAQ